MAAFGECIHRCGVVADQTRRRVGRRLQAVDGGGDRDPPIRRRAVRLDRRAIDAVEERRVAVVAVVSGDDTGASGEVSRHSPGEVVRLAARAREHHGVEARRHRCHQSLGVFDDRLEQVARIRVEHPRLAAQRRDDMGMTVPDVRHVVVSVEEAPAIVVEDPHAFPAHGMERRVVVEPKTAKHMFSPLEQLGVGRHHVVLPHWNACINGARHGAIDRLLPTDRFAP